MINKNIKHLLYILTFFLYSCSSVQEYVFPTLEDEEVTSPPALEDVPQSIDTAQEESIPQQIPPSQFAPPPAPVQQADYDTGPTGTCVYIVNRSFTFASAERSPVSASASTSAPEDESVLAPEPRLISIGT